MSPVELAEVTKGQCEALPEVDPGALVAPSVPLKVGQRGTAVQDTPVAPGVPLMVGQHGTAVQGTPVAPGVPQQVGQLGKATEILRVPLP